MPMFHQCWNLTCGGKCSERPYNSCIALHSCWCKAWLFSAAHEQNRCHAPDHHKWCTVKCDEVDHPSWNISPQDAWYTGLCSLFPGFHPAPHTYNFEQNPREWYTMSVISSFFCLRCWAWLFAMKECAVKLSTLYTSNLMKLSTSAVRVHSVVLSMLSHWLHDISSSISSSAYLFLMKLSRAGYPGQFLQRCTMHLRLVVSHTTITIKSGWGDVIQPVGKHQQNKTTETHSWCGWFHRVAGVQCWQPYKTLLHHKESKLSISNRGKKKEQTECIILLDFA